MEIFNSLWTTIFSGRNFGAVEIPPQETTPTHEELLTDDVPKASLEENKLVEDVDKDVMPEEFRLDLAALSLKFGHLDPGMTIAIELQELLQIAPRQRKRTDAYHKLLVALKKYLNVELLITSRKKNGHKNKT